MVIALGAASCAGAPKDDYENQFRQRADFYTRQVAIVDPARVMDWSDRIKLGDPHKYAMPAILARLSLNAQDDRALAGYRRLMAVDKTKSDRGLYHFAAYPRTRMYFAFGPKLPKDITDSMVFEVTNFFGQLRSGGTENHAWMHRTSGYLWAEHLPAVGSAKVPDSDKTNLQWTRDWLRTEVRKWYTVGQGEYDSSTYIAFNLAAWSNVYDYTSDAKMKDLARAALDWEAAAMALKYFHGCNLGPEARGFADSAVTTITDWAGWLWWDGSARPIRPANPDLGDGDGQRNLKDADISIHATICLAMSQYRPHPVIRNIATKNVKLPFEARGSKPSYYGPTPNKDQEYLYVNDQYAMGTLYSAEDGLKTTGTILPQTTMFKVAVLDKDNVRTFGASNGYHRHFPLEGRTPYDQYHQHRDAAINICYVDKPEDNRTRHRSIFGVPLAAGEPGYRENGWYFWQVNKAYVGVKALNGKAEFGQVTRADDSGGMINVESKTHRWLVSPGSPGGWVVQLGQQPQYPSLNHFAKAVLNDCVLDTSKLATDRIVTFKSLAGDTLKIRHTGGPGGRPEAWTNGKAVDFTQWPVYESPYMNQATGSGILRLTDGKQTLIIDYSGEWPVFADR